MAAKRKRRKEKMGTEVSVCPDRMCVHRTYSTSDWRPPRERLIRFSNTPMSLTDSTAGQRKEPTSDFSTPSPPTSFSILPYFPLEFFFSLLWVGNYFFPFYIPRTFLLISSNELSARKTAVPSKRVRLLALHKAQNTSVLWASHLQLWCRGMTECFKNWASYLSR